MAGAFALTIGAIAGHRVSVDAEGNLLRLDHPAGSAAWWGTRPDRGAPDDRAELADIAGRVFAGITLTGPVRIIGSAGILVAFFALPASMGVAILKYRLYDIDRVISRTLAYAIVTGLLIGVYAGLVLLATEVLKLKGPVSVAAVVQSVLEPAHLSVWTTPASDT
jgi:hypothetical protein